MRFGLKQANVIWYQDVQDLVKEHIGIEIDIQNSEYSNGSYLESWESISKPDPDDLEAINLYFEKVRNDSFDEDDDEFDLDAYLKYLVHLDVLPEGEYIVTIWW